MSEICVLIIEDRPEFGGVLARFFQEAGCKATVVASVDEALAFAGCKPDFKIITVDLNLGEGAGAEVTISRIGEVAKAHPDSLVVVISGVVTPADTERLLSAGAHGFMPKMELGTLHGFGGNFSTWLASLTKTPPRLTRNVEAVEGLAKHFAQWTQQFVEKPKP